RAPVTNPNSSIAEPPAPCSNLVIRVPPSISILPPKIAFAGGFTVRLAPFVFMNRNFRFVLLLFVSVVTGVGVWAALRFTAPQKFWRRDGPNEISAPVNYND